MFDSHRHFQSSAWVCPGGLKWISIGYRSWGTVHDRLEVRFGPEQERSGLGFGRASVAPAPTLAAEPVFEVPVRPGGSRTGTSGVGSVAKVGAGETERCPKPSSQRTPGLPWTTPPSTAYGELPPNIYCQSGTRASARGPAAPLNTAPPALPVAGANPPRPHTPAPGMGRSARGRRTRHAREP